MEPAAPPCDVVIRLRGITKRFPGIVANDAISLDVRRGEVHCLLGENGAGKSTLISMLAGIQQPDEGTLEVNGVPTKLSSPAVSLAHGIGVVFQHSELIPTFTVLENLMLAESRNVWLDRAGAVARLAELSALLGVQIDPDMLAGDLGLGQQQQVELAKAMWRGSEVLVLDEPTSMLPPHAIDRLLQSITRLARNGLAVIFVSHKLHEALAVGDAVTVLRGGAIADEITPPELRGLSPDDARVRILAAMFDDSAAAGMQATDHVSSTAKNTAIAAGTPTLLTVAGVATGQVGSEVPVAGVSFTIRSGEIVGVAGIEGNGQRHLAEALAGQRETTEGTIKLDGSDITGLGVKRRQRLGVRYVTDDRLHEGVVGSLSVSLNLVLKQIGDAPFWRGGRMNRRAIAQSADHHITAYGIRTPSRSSRAGTLSGGNIQKILLARELAGDPRVLILHKPTYGLDLHTASRVHELVRDFVRNGGAVLLISADLDEIQQLAHRVLVLSEGAIVGQLENDGSAPPREGTLPERVGAFMVGSAGSAGSTGSMPVASGRSDSSRNGTTDA